MAETTSYHGESECAEALAPRPLNVYYFKLSRSRTALQARSIDSAALAAAVPEVLYTTAQEAAGFGAQASPHDAHHQLSATVGRGFAAKVVLTNLP